MSTRPGEVVLIQTCWTESGQPADGHQVLFVEQDATGNERKVVTTDAHGIATFILSRSSETVARVVACDASGCLSPIIVVWERRKGSQEVAGPPPPDPLDTPPNETFSLAATGIEVAPEGSGYTCVSGPHASAHSIPGFALVEEASERVSSHPRSGKSVRALSLRTSQNLPAGSVIYGLPSAVYAFFRDRGPTDDTGVFPFRGFGRAYVFWSDGATHVGKQELRFDGSAWRSRPPTFTVGIEGPSLSFFPDSSLPARDQVALVVSTAGVCSSVGTFAEAPPIRPGLEPNLGPRSATAIGFALLLLIAGLVISIMRSSRPPSGTIARTPIGPSLHWERRSITFDQQGRTTSYIDINHQQVAEQRVRVRVVQEGLLVEEIQGVEMDDWDDPLAEILRTDFEVDHRGRPSSYVETVTSGDGERIRSLVSNITYDAYDRVVRYDRSIQSADGGPPRHQSFVLENDSVPEALRTEPPRLAERERIVRSDLTYDSEAHVSGYRALSTVMSEGDSKQRTAPLPLQMFLAGARWPSVPVFESVSDQGLARTRHVLRRWFRRHACRVEISLGAGSHQFIFGDIQGVTDDAGRATVWALERGNYPLSAPVDGLAVLTAWVGIDHVPGNVNVELGPPA